MAQNRRDELEAAQSSSEEEEGSSEEQEGSESESEEEKTSQPTPPPPSKKPSDSKKPATHPTPAAVPRSSSSADTGSESDSDTDSPPEKPVKPITSKPMEDPPKSTKKPRSKPTPEKSAAGAKRPSESEAEESKRAKKKTTTGDDTKKQLFQRLWSEEDEIAILKGMIEYTIKKGADPVADMTAFHDFIKKSLHVDVTKNQLSDKVRRLKKKYVNNASKDRTFSKPHELQAYEFSKKVWGNKDANNVDRINGTEKKNQNQNPNPNQKSSKVAASPNPKQLLSKSAVSPKADSISPIVEVKNSVIELEPSGSVQFCASIADARFEEEIIRKNWDLIPGAKRAEMDEKWKKLQVEAVEHYLKRVEFIREQADMVLEAMKSAGH